MLEFVNSNRFRELAALGTSCPDHFLRTKIRPLVIDCDPGAVTPKEADLDRLLQEYREEYTAYYERCKDETRPPCAIPTP